MIGVEMADRDMIEFGETGPLSRFYLYREDQPVRTTVADILSDALAYLQIPIEAGHGFRFEAGHRSDVMSATIPI